MTAKTPAPAKANPLVPALALLVLAFVVLFFTLRLALPATVLETPVATSSPTPTRTATRTATRTPSVTLTSTITLTPRPTWTLRPSTTPSTTGTATATPSRTLYPTLKAATPYKYNDLYALNTWTAADADRVVAQLLSYPDSLYPKPQDRLAPGYDAAYFYPAFAAREALLRFPEAYAAPRWRWALAYSLTRSNDPQAADLYASLISEALSAAQTTLADLPAWFERHEPNLTLSVQTLALLPGYLDRSVITIGSSGGRIYLYLTQTPAQLSVTPLLAQLDFAHAIEPALLTGDLTGDGLEEAVIFHTQPHGDFLVEPPHIFSLEARPRQLPIAARPPLDMAIAYQTEMHIRSGALEMTLTVFPPCPLTVVRTYIWDGVQFTADDWNYTLTPAPGAEALCETIVNHAAANWRPERVIPMMETLLPLWPPAADAHGDPYPADAGDAWRYRLGLYHALAGNHAAALQYLSAVADAPTVADSRWISAANQFLAIYHSPADLYRACLAEPLCSPRVALQQLTILSAAQDPSLALAFLQSHGVSTRVSGYFDFDNDGALERWLSVRHRPQDKLEFWILTASPAGVRALFVSTVEINTPAPYYHEPWTAPPIVQIEMGQGFVLSRLAESGEPFVTHVNVEFTPTTLVGIRDALQTATQLIFSSGEPTQARDALLAAEKLPRFTEVCRAYRLCDHFYYLLGLSYEFSGAERSAVAAYLNAWWENSRGPFAIMVRQRLLQNPPRPTFTPTVTLTATITHTLDPNATPTGTPTITHTPDPNATPTDTPTITSTPDPNATATETNTPTETSTPTATQEP